MTTTKTTERYTAILDNEDLTVRYAILPAGVDGPMFSEGRPATLDDVDTILTAYGLERTEGWRIRNTYRGMALEADLRKVEVRPAPARTNTLDGWPLLPGEDLLGPAR